MSDKRSSFKGNRFPKNGLRNDVLSSSYGKNSLPKVHVTLAPVTAGILLTSL